MKSMQSIIALLSNIQHIKYKPCLGAYGSMVVHSTTNLRASDLSPHSAKAATSSEEGYSSLQWTFLFLGLSVQIW